MRFVRIASLFLALLLVCLLNPRAARADGLIVIHHPPVIVPGHFSFAPLEVTYHKVECAIDGQAAVTSVDQEFYNPNGGPALEGEQIFPVPKDANINKFSMDIDGKAVDAELLDADKARKIYEDIVRASRDPALLEYAGRSMYKVRIFPIDPMGKKRIQLKYTELLKQDNGLLDYHYTLNTEKFSSKLIKNVSLKISIAGTEPITTLYSPTHDVEIIRPKDDQNRAMVGYEAKDVRPDTDFHLYIGRKATPVGISLMTYRPDPAKDGYFVLMAAPTINPSAKPMPKDVVFVMDTSGSMNGVKIEQARKALQYCVNTLNPTDNFDIIRFSTESESFFGGLKQASGDNPKKAAEFAAGLKAAGGTAIDEALQKAIEEVGASTAGPGPDHLRMIVFMTDGEPTVGEQNPDAILAHVKKTAGGVPIRIFSFGVGDDVNTKLLDLIADQTRGYTQYVLPKENLELAMSNFWGKVQDPVLANLKLDMGDAHASKLYPKDMPDLFKGDQLIVFGTYAKSGNGAVTITGTSDGKEHKFAQDVTFEDKTDSSKEWIAKLWATRRVGYLLDEIRLHGENQELKDEIVGLSRQWGVVTPYTAMLIIEDEKRRNVPVAQRSLSEMEGDRAAMRGNQAEFDSLKEETATGGQAIANSVNSSAYAHASSLDAADKAIEQKDAHQQYAGSGGAMMRAIDSAQPYDAAKAPVAANDWRAGAARAGNGYRVITNYAQQTRVVNNRAFYLNGNQATDSQIQKTQDAKPVKIPFNSDAYFDLLKSHPDAAQYLSLGANVTVEIAGTVYDIVEETAKQNP